MIDLNNMLTELKKTEAFKHALSEYKTKPKQNIPEYIQTTLLYNMLVRELKKAHL